MNNRLFAAEAIANHATDFGQNGEANTLKMGEYFQKMSPELVFAMAGRCHVKNYPTLSILSR